MVMENLGGCLPNPFHHHIPMSAPDCMYGTNNHRFHDGAGAIGLDVGSSRHNNLCGASVDLMTDVLLHSSLLEDSQAMTSINPTLTIDAALPAGSASLDLSCIPAGTLQDPLWWVVSPADLIVNNTAMQPPAPDHNNNNNSNMMIPTTSPAAAAPSMPAHHLDVLPVGSSGRYLEDACKDEAGGALLASAILSHCAGNTTSGTVDDSSIGMWRSLIATCCTSGNAAAAASPVDSEEPDMYGNPAAGSSSYTNSCAQQGNRAVVDISFQHGTSCSPAARLGNDPAPAMISLTTSPYNLRPQQQLPGNANRVPCSDSIPGQEHAGGTAPLLQYSGNTSASTAATGTSFSIDFENPNSSTTSKPPKRPRSADRAPMMSSSTSHRPTTPSIDFGCADVDATSCYEPDPEAVAQVKEMIYRAAAFRPVNLGADEAVERPRRKNVRISSDPQTVAARHRRERISERLRVLQRLVPGGSKMDTASMLDEAANYLKFLKSQVSALEGGGNRSAAAAVTLGFKNAIINAAATTPTSTGSCGGIPLLPSSSSAILAATSSSLSRLDQGFDIPFAQATPKTIPSQLRDHSIQLGNRALH